MTQKQPDASTGVLEPVEVELQLLCLLLNDPDTYARVRHELSSDGLQWMSQPHHEAVWQAIAKIGNGQGYIDIGTVADRLAQDNRLAFVGGHPFLRKVSALSTSPEALPYLLQRVRGAAYYRELQRSLNEAQEMLRGGRDPGDLYEHLTASARMILGGGGQSNAILWGPDSLVYTEGIIQEALDKYANNTPSLDWPWPNWNAFVEPLEPGTVALIAGLTGLGKTMLAESVAEYWAKRGFKVVFFHYEINRSNMMRRRLSRAAGVTWSKLRQGNLDDDDLLKIQRAQALMDVWKDNIHYVHSPGWTAAEVRSEVRKLVSLGECDVFIVDYLTKVAPSSVRGLGGVNPAQSLEYIFNTLKNAAEEEPAVAGVVLSQYNNAAGKVKTVWDLSETMIRNSGAPFQMANLVVFLFGSKLENDFRDAGGQVIAKSGEYSPNVDCLVAKQTFGGLGKTNLFFLRKYGRLYPPKQSTP